jgi:hypothetical protein
MLAHVQRMCQKTQITESIKLPECIYQWTHSGLFAAKVTYWRYDVCSKMPQITEHSAHNPNLAGNTRCSRYLTCKGKNYKARNLQMKAPQAWE